MISGRELVGVWWLGHFGAKMTEWKTAEIDGLTFFSILR